MSFSYDDSEYLNRQLVSIAKQPFLGYKIGVARAVFTATGGKLIGAHELDCVIPEGAVLKRATYKVLTTFTSATDAATIALSVVGANDLVSAVAISDGGNPWDAGSAVATLVTDTEASWLNVTADKRVTATVAVEDLTAGKLVVFFEYYYYGDLAAT